MLDLEVSASVWKTVSATFALDNILDGRSDYWEGYNESPRSIALSVRYGF
jgi:outer membrane cobalamin receptor